MNTDWVTHLEQASKKHHSQTGEDGILEEIFNHIETTNKVSVEFGAGNGYTYSNTRHFIDAGWTGHQWDIVPHRYVKQEVITAENVNSIFAKHGVPPEFDLLSIDIDGIDYWVWKNLEAQPRVVVMEFNGAIPMSESKTIPNIPNFKHDGTNYFGASLTALQKLGVSKGYTLVHQTHSLNAFFIRTDIVPGLVPTISFKPIFGHPPDKMNRPWEYV